MKTAFYRSLKFQKQYLSVTAFIIGSFGPVFCLGTIPDFDYSAAITLDLLSWPIDGKQFYEGASMRFLSALTGGFLFGWGVCILGLRYFVFDKAPNAVRKAVLFGIIAWFILDSIGSILSSHASNVLFNVLVLFIAVGPFWFSINENVYHEK